VSDEIEETRQARCRMRTFDERPGYRANHLKRDGGSDWDRGWLWQRPRLRRMAWTGPRANLDRRPHDPRQLIETRKSLFARPVRSGCLGRVGQDRAIMAEAGMAAAHAEMAKGIVLRRIPITLPDESLASS